MLIEGHPNSRIKLAQLEITKRIFVKFNVVSFQNKARRGEPSEDDGGDRHVAENHDGQREDPGQGEEKQKEKEFLKDKVGFSLFFYSYISICTISHGKPSWFHVISSCMHISLNEKFHVLLCLHIFPSFYLY